MADPDPAEPTRDDVIRWMREHGASIAVTAAHFGLHVERVKTWHRRTRGQPLVGERKGISGVGAKGVDGNGGGKSPAPAPSRAKQSAGIVDLTAVAPEMRVKLRRGAWGLADFLASVADAQEATAKAKEERAALYAKGVRGETLDTLCPLPAAPDMRQVDAAARALKSTLEIAPGLAGFEKDTGEQTVADANKAEVERRIASVFGTPAPPAFEVLAGGVEGEG